MFAKMVTAVFLFFIIIITTGCTPPENSISTISKSTLSQKSQNQTYTDSLGITWIFVTGGRFTMGKMDRILIAEGPPHTVSVSDFYISETEITFNQYDKFCDANGRIKPDDNGWGRGSRPVINISWEDAKAYCEYYKVRLPTEAEWEFAATGGNKSQHYKYSGSHSPDEVAWYKENSSNRTHVVKTKASNELGIYDMSGNVIEMCADWYDSNYYSRSPLENPINDKPTGEYFNGPSCRGGSFVTSAVFLESVSRTGGVSTDKKRFLGFRITHN